MASPEPGSVSLIRVPLLDTKGVWDHVLREQGDSVLRRIVRARRSVEERGEQAKYAVVGRDEYESLCAEVYVRHFPTALITHVFDLAVIVVDAPGLVEVVLAPDREWATKIRRPIPSAAGPSEARQA